MNSDIWAVKELRRHLRSGIDRGGGRWIIGFLGVVGVPDCCCWLCGTAACVKVSPIWTYMMVACSQIVVQVEF